MIEVRTKDLESAVRVAREYRDTHDVFKVTLLLDKTGKISLLAVPWGKAGDVAIQEVLRRRWAGEQVEIAGYFSRKRELNDLDTKPDRVRMNCEFHAKFYLHEEVKLI